VKYVEPVPHSSEHYQQLEQQLLLERKQLLGEDEKVSNSGEQRLASGEADDSEASFSGSEDSLHKQGICSRCSV